MKKLSMVLILVLLLQVETASSKSKNLEADTYRGESYKSALSFKEAVKKNKLREKTNKTVDMLVRVAEVELKKKGAFTLAANIRQEYEARYLTIFLDERGVGDHEGVAWLLSIHGRVEFVLGESICRATRLHDLWVLAETIPVCFSCIDSVDNIEYLLHFVPFSGVVSYWGSVILCTGATLGSGVTFLCGFIGMGVEAVVERFVAPPLSQGCWKRACHQ